ncbi:nicotinate phosphoribosyltransferase [Candidatus Pacearchaeota archaeon]|nr:nicotinate phosphoribosyltransferase [Candidatus Pacearchaeota archaeon]
MRDNICLNTDSYKQSHHLQYPPGTINVYSYVESRGGDFDQSVFFGLQMFMRQYLEGCRVSLRDINEAAEMATLHGLPFNYQGWVDILRNHNGRLPIEIRAIPEGAVSPVSNYMLSVENTDPSAYWLTTFLETAILRAIWYPTTVATLSFEAACIIYSYLQETSDDPDGQMPFKLHDFGARGVSSKESAGIGGLAHLVNFQGTDTMEALRYAREFYGCDMAGFSIPAAEHSTITSWGRENEVDAFENMLNQFAKEGAIVAVVSDSYNIFDACSHLWGNQLRQKVLDSGATIVVRPDSGDIVEVVMLCLKILDDRFGATVNSKGYRVLNPAIRIIQGDGMNIRSIPMLLEAVKASGYSTENLAMGMGGGLLQQVNRDTMKFAMKCSAIQVRGEADVRPVYKQPITDPGKDSKKGRLTLVKNLDTGVYKTVSYPLAHGHKSFVDQARTVFRNGEILVTDTLDQIRERAKSALQLQVSEHNYL